MSNISLLLLSYASQGAAVVAKVVVRGVDAAIIQEEAVHVGIKAPRRGPPVAGAALIARTTNAEEPRARRISRVEVSRVELKKN